MIDGIIAFLYQTKQTKRQKQMSFIEKNKTIFEVDAPPVGKN
jgi:hypothetical protein